MIDAAIAPPKSAPTTIAILVWVGAFAVGAGWEPARAHALVQGAPVRFCPAIPSARHILWAASLSALASCQHDRPIGPAATLVSAERDVTLAPDADTYIKQGHPNQNQGTEAILRLQSSGNNRALLRWDPAAIAAAIGGDSVVAARLELTIVENGDNWGSAGRTVALHRLTRAWTETGVTWNCAIDANPANQTANCSGETRWAMDGAQPRPWVTPASATVLITNGQRGVVTFDVTADVRALLAGGTAHGWILKKANEGASGRVEFGSRETAQAPALALTLLSGEPSDTTRPPVPTSYLLPDDSARTIPSPFGTAERYYRDIVGVVFEDTTSGLAIRAILTKYRATIIGGGVSFPHPVYYLQIPDPGGTYSAIDSVARAIDGEPGVFAATLPQWRGRVQIRSRFPNDGPSATRADWFRPTDATRGLLAIRAPLAWGCETGAYANTARIAMIDREFRSHTDLQATIRSPVSRLEFSGIPTIDDFEHGIRVAGILGATGDNGMGIAGMLWRSDLTLYPLGANGRESTYPFADFIHHLALIDDHPRTRVLSMSATFGSPGDTANVRWLVQGLEIYLRNGGMLIYAIGNDSQARPTVAELRTTTDSRFSAVDRAVALLRDSLGFGGNIITVGASDSAGAFLSTTTFWRGGTDILAPGQRVLTLGLNNSTSMGEGTSYATPYVAGVAAQLLTLDPSLSAAEIKDLILRGARSPRWNAHTSRQEPPPPAPGAPEIVYQLDAYGALQLAAARNGTPLCGNRVWSENGNIVVQRDTTRDPARREVIANLGTTAHAVTVMHGGRRIEYSTSDADLIVNGYFAIKYENGAWGTPVTLSGLAVGAERDPTGTQPIVGGAARATIGVSHDGDRMLGTLAFGHGQNAEWPVTLYNRGIDPASPGPFLCFAFGDESSCYTPGPATSIATGLRPPDGTCALPRIETDRYPELCEGFITVPGFERIQVATTVYPQVGDTAFVILNRWRASVSVQIDSQQFHSFDLGDTATFAIPKFTYLWRTHRAEIYRVTLQNLAGQTPELIRVVADSSLYWAGLAEDGGQGVVAVGAGELLEYYNMNFADSTLADPFARELACVIEYRDPRFAGVRDARDRITAPGACPPFFGAWTGTIAPAPPSPVLRR